MPGAVMADVILNAAETIAREWRVLAIAWHAAAFALLVGVVRRFPTRAIAAATTLPMFSVAALAAWSGNPFNAVIFAAGGALLLRVAARLPEGGVRLAAGWQAAAGAALCVFGWSYPHFLHDAGWRYLVEAPLGLLPCPTLAFVIGVSLITRSFDSRTWAITVSSLGVMYGAIGVWALNVSIDWLLLAGATALISSRFAHRQDAMSPQLHRYRRHA